MDLFSSQTMRAYVCNCGRVHIETRHVRKSFSVGEFISLLRAAIGDTASGRVKPESPHGHGVEMQTNNGGR